jgi:hypothetical protein
MSGTNGGSGYGLGAYGKGPYGFATRIMGARAGTRATMRPQLIAQAQLIMTSPAPMSFGLVQMWAAVQIAPCVPWTPISECAGCAQAVPNKAGNMFPGLGGPP